MAKSTPTLQHLDPTLLSMEKQVRVERNERADKELFESVKTRGVLLPIRARKVGDKYVVIDGHRRTEAAQAAKLESIPVYVVADAAAAEILTDQMVTNIQREGLSILDTAKGVRQLYEGPGGGSATYVAQKLGKPNSWISKMLVIAGGGRDATPAPLTAKLLSADKLTDLEAAYTLAKIEALNPEAAKEAADNIENETRATLKKRLANTKAPQAAAYGDDDEETDYTPGLEWALDLIQKAAVSKRTAPLQALAIEYLQDVIGGEEAEEEEADM